MRTKWPAGLPNGRGRCQQYPPRPLLLFAGDNLLQRRAQTIPLPNYAAACGLPHEPANNVRRLAVSRINPHKAGGLHGRVVGTRSPPHLQPEFVGIHHDVQICHSEIQRLCQLLDVQIFERAELIISCYWLQSLICISLMPPSHFVLLSPV